MNSKSFLIDCDKEPKLKHNTGIVTSECYVVSLRDLLPLKEFNFAYDLFFQATPFQKLDGSKRTQEIRYYTFNFVRDHLLKPKLNYLSLKKDDEILAIVSKETLEELNKVVNKTLVNKANKACKNGLKITFEEPKELELWLFENEDGILDSLSVK